MTSSQARVKSAPSELGRREESRLRVLVVDNDRQHRELIVRRLRNEFPTAGFIEVADREGLDRALDGGCDVVLTDYRLQWSDGLRVLRLVKEKYPHTPVVMVTETGSEEIAAEGMKSGLSDYVLKARLDRLPQIVRQEIEKARLRREHDRALEQIRISEERYRAISELSSDYAYSIRVEPGGRLQWEWVTQALQRITGYSAEDLKVDIGLSSIVHPEDAEAARVRESKLREGKPDVSEFRVLTRSGGVRWLREIARPVRDAGGRLTHILGSGQDITEHKRAEEERARRIREQMARMEAEAGERRYRMLAEAIPQIVWTARPDGSIDYLNRRWSEYTGMPAGEAQGWKWEQMVHPGDLERYQESWKRSVATGELFELEYRLRRSDGAYLWHLGRAVALKNGGGSVIKWFGSATNIDPQKRAEEALRRSDERFRLVTKATNDAIWDWDLATDTIQWNEVLETAFGHVPDSSRSKGSWRREMIHPEDREQVWNGLGRAIDAGEEIWTDEYRFRRADGSYAGVIDRGYVVHDDSGKPVRMIGAMQDNSARKGAEERLRRSNEDLQHFAYVASHDLQEPLRTIASYTQLLAKRYHGKLDADADQFIQFITGAVTRMHGLLNDLLAYSRAVDTRSEHRKELTSTEAVLQWTLMNLNAAIKDNEAVVTHDPLPPVYANQTRLVLVFQNLIGNAIKYRKKDEPPRIHVSAQQRGDEWVFSVRDNGIGIDPRYHQQVFGAFKRLHGREYPGSGIGLAISSRIIERHGGRMWVESEPDKGSTFYFTMPA